MNITPQITEALDALRDAMTERAKIQQDYENARKQADQKAMMAREKLSALISIQKDQ